MKTIDVIALAEERDPDVWRKIERLQKRMPRSVIDLQELCEDIPNVSMSEEYLPSNVSGVIAKHADGEYAIQVNASEPSTRQRFTAAHELAHYLLHRKQIDRAPKGMLRENTFLRGGVLSNREETEANQLAAEILMPYPALFKFMADNPGRSLRELADQFKVSTSAMSIRLGIPLY